MSFANMGLCHQFQRDGTCTYGALCKFSHAASIARPMVQARPTPERVARKKGVSHIAAFFETYPQFDYDPAEPVMDEWRRLCEELGLDPENMEDYAVRKSRRDLKTALVLQFNKKYGEDAEDLDAWQNLCRKVDIPVPNTLYECQEAIRGTHVNLVDLTDLRDGEVPEKFPTEVALSAYTLCSGDTKIFPRDHAEAGGLLRMLLRHIMNPRPEWQVRGTGGGKRGRRRR